MSVYLHDVECPECYGEATLCHDIKTYALEIVCTDPLCENANSDLYEVQKARFEAALADNDYAIGDSFWIGSLEFEVVGKRE